MFKNVKLNILYQYSMYRVAYERENTKWKSKTSVESFKKVDTRIQLFAKVMSDCMQYSPSREAKKIALDP